MEIIFARAADFFFFYFYVYTHTRVLLQFLRLISEKSLSPERRGRPPRRNGSFTKKRKTNIFRMQHSATVYIYFFFHTRAFSKIFGDVYRGYSNSIWKSGSSHGEELAKYPRGINFNKFSSFWQRFNPDVLSETVYKFSLGPPPSPWPVYHQKRLSRSIEAAPIRELISRRFVARLLLP